jgi:succinylglutamate desuccinylase
LIGSRIIGRYTQDKPGPLLVVFGAMHGNEPAGVEAVKEVLNLIEQEKNHNPNFEFKGVLLGIIGNQDALNKNIRFINKDLNRSWSYDDYKIFSKLSYEEYSSEQKEIFEIIAVLRAEVAYSNPKNIVVLDLHTTSSEGGIFSIITDDPESEKIAIQLHAPVVKGMLREISDSSIHFFHGENMGIPTTAIAFESGQHDDPLSIKRGSAAIVNCMRTIGNVSAKDVENKHDDLLISFSKNLPKVNELIGKYSVKNKEIFKMLPGFKSFSKVHKGQLLAIDEEGDVYCEEDALLLMPLYQKLGQDGFFLIKPE